MKDNVWCFQYNYCIYEGSFATISIHKTPKGAYNAMRAKILQDYNKWRECGIRYGKKYFKHGSHEDWRVVKIPILP